MNNEFPISFVEFTTPAWVYGKKIFEDGSIWPFMQINTKYEMFVGDDYIYFVNKHEKEIVFHSKFGNTLKEMLQKNLLTDNSRQAYSIKMIDFQTNIEWDKTEQKWIVK